MSLTLARNLLRHLRHRLQGPATPRPPGPWPPEPRPTGSADYAERAAAEGKAWGKHLEVEATGELHAWLDHPAINAHYQERACIDGLDWPAWVIRELGGPAACSLDLGCGAGGRSMVVWHAGATREVHGVDISAERVAVGDQARQEAGAPGRLWAEDVNALELPAERYDLIFSAHSFHHFLALEHVMAEVAKALAPGGLFVLEEFVGPTQFQWTDLQIGLTRGLLGWLPPERRRLRWGAIKEMEGRPTVEQVVAVSPFESIRSAEILPLFAQFFDVVMLRRLGGTLQHLLYNGIVHNFVPFDDAAQAQVEQIWRVEDALVDSAVLPSDFVLIAGRRRGG